ncbi:MAG: sulfite exporter TauE/SafE family protein [Gammaproteobacteria bacterium]|mgnify:CR=1 FL=1|jgi:hypothetical protein|nr:sulfite exporter TauE/SafE family protein [Gammaproteobacteria bacterium]MCP4881568.1 sulfite exporter TauE/SafE family protein [Gammaproteobacteria bacterium]MDP6165982.1 sulfite exporter TauE/SafE family protein [Gammaproteobacteria bacterium]
MLFAMYLALGAFSGLLAGLFGIGGGIIVVPVLVFAFSLQGINPDILMHMAIATSLANIVFTATSAIRTHQKKGAISWHLVKPIALGMLLGSYIGVNTAVAAPGEVLQGLFGAFALYLSAKMIWLTQRPPQKQLPGTRGLAITGTVIGWASAIFGIGGGNLLVSWLVNRGIIMQQAVATAAACGLAIGLAGAITNMLVGWGHPLLPDYSLGYIYLPALVGIVATSAFAANYGAKIAHRLPAKKLQKMFALLLLLAGLRMLASVFL